MNQVLTTQQGLNQLFNTNLIEDGVLGNKTLVAMTVGVDSMKAIFTKNGYALYILYGCEEDVKDELL